MCSRLLTQCYLTPFCTNCHIFYHRSNIKNGRRTDIFLYFLIRYKILLDNAVFDYIWLTWSPTAGYLTRHSAINTHTGLRPLRDPALPRCFSRRCFVINTFVQCSHVNSTPRWCPSPRCRMVVWCLTRFLLLHSVPHSAHLWRGTPGVMGPRSRPGEATAVVSIKSQSFWNASWTVAKVVSNF